MDFIQYSFVAVLVGVLCAASVSFTIMGLGKVRRRRRLARQAHQRGLKFFPDDPYDVPRRYADFAVISSGHSPCANNVTAGGFGGRSIREFDFRCELGHGTRRLTRQYSVAVAETRTGEGNLLMWHEGDAELAPLAARDAPHALGQWSYIGSPELARDVQAACAPLAQACPCIEVRGQVILIAAPVQRAMVHYVMGMQELSAAIDAIESALAARRQQPGATMTPADAR